MRIYRDFKALPPGARGSAVAVGNFDGVHRGHAAVIGEAGRIARALGVPHAVLTFEPHPRSVLRPGPPFRLTPFRAKARAIAGLGVDALVVLRFDRAFAQRSAESFVGDVLAGGLAARHVVSGYDFEFGRARQGNCALLLAMGRDLGFGFTSVAASTDGDGLPHSASRVRALLAAGDVAAAARILGRPFEIEGRVVAGDRRGRDLGFPTANLRLGELQRPAMGVYAVRVAREGDGGRWYGGVANLGRRPTFAGQDERLEAHLFDFQGDLYGARLCVRLLKHLRPERRFDGIAALRTQIAADCAEAREYLAKA